jgi:hypothetical protein
MGQVKLSAKAFAMETFIERKNEMLDLPFQEEEVDALIS